MEKVDIHEIEKIITSLLPNKTVRQECLIAFSESIKQADLYGENKWGVYYLRDRVRLLVGNLIVCTIHKNGVWLALERELLNTSNDKHHLLELSKSWQWDTNSYPEYTQIPSKNGYYLPAQGDANIWYEIRAFHFEFIRKVAEKYEKLNKRSQLKHKPEVLTYLSRVLEQPIPKPFYNFETYAENGINPLQEIEEYQASYENLPETERAAVVQSRIGQGKFRSDLIKYWTGCAVTNCVKSLAHQTLAKIR